MRENTDQNNSEYGHFWFLKELNIFLLNLDKTLLDFKCETKANYRRDFPYCKLKVISRSKCRLDT